MQVRAKAMAAATLSLSSVPLPLLLLLLPLLLLLLLTLLFAASPIQTLQRQRDKFVPLPYVASELGALDELPEGVESDSTGEQVA